jgi:protein-disulfide isomerase
VLLVSASAGATWFLARPPEPAAVQAARPGMPLALTAGPMLGNARAPVTIVEFSDFECPFCRTFATRTFPKVQESYIASGRVSFAFRHLPLEFHASAWRAATIAGCAWRRDRFWDIHDGFYRATASLSAEIPRLAGSILAMSPETLDRCTADAASLVDADIRLAGLLGIDGTPTFIVATKNAAGKLTVESILSGAVPFSQMAKTIDAALNAADRQGGR